MRVVFLNVQDFGLSWLNKLLIQRYKDTKQCAEYTKRQNENSEMMYVCRLLW
jgi:hypothetical protein